MNTKPIFKSSAGEEAILALYDSLLARWPVAHEELAIPTRHGETFVVASGAAGAPPMVLLHGSSTNSAMWAGDVVEYSRDHRVYAVDILGEPGHSAPVRPAWKSSGYVEWLEDLLAALAVERAIIVGCSLGAYVALQFATARPELVEKLVLLAPGGITPVKTSALLRIVAVSLFGRRGAESVNRMVYRDVIVPDEVRAFGSLIQENYNPRTDPQPLFTDEQLERLTMPVLLVAGAKDCFFESQKTAERLRRLVPQFQAAILPDTGHVLLDTPQLIRPFLDATGSLPVSAAAAAPPGGPAPARS